MHIGAIAVDPSNVEQLQAWDGDVGAYWADHAERFDLAIATHHGPWLEAAAIDANDRVVDVGCGTGQTTRDAARTARSGTALGVDLSARMLDHARRRAAAEQVANATFRQADAQINPFTPETFDVAISRTGAMFFGDPVAAFTNIGRALVPGGRLALLVWQPAAVNEWIGELSRALAAGRPPTPPPADAPGPFSLGDPDTVRTILTASGFGDTTFEGRTAAMWFGRDAEDAQRFVLGLMGGMLDGLDEAGRSRAISDLQHTLAAHTTTAGVVFQSATWTILARRV